MSKHFSVPTLDCTGKTYALTGGGGYFGRRLCEHLIRHGAARVHLFDVRKPALPEGVPSHLADRVRLFQGDIRVLDDVVAAFAGVETVFHIASYGMSGKEQLASELIYQVNVIGTKNALQAAQQCGVSAFVYTSTTNVIFGGKSIINGDETLPYCDLELHTDNYSRTKAIAEQLVLEAHGKERTASADGAESKSAGVRSRGAPKRLKTCAIRPAGIYGENEERHFPRIVSYLKAGLFRFTFGSKDNRVEFVHADNLAEAHILAANSLALEDGAAGGQPYFVSDGQPVNNFEFMRPLVEGLGYTYPTIVLPYTLVYFVAWVIEWIHFIVGRVYNFQPLLTRTEVNKTGVTHFFKIEKARRELGYDPKITPDEGMRRLVASFVAKEKQLEQERRKKQAEHDPMRVFVLVTCSVFGALVLGLFAFVIYPELSR